jgi:hypothetical protein
VSFALDRDGAGVVHVRFAINNSPWMSRELPWARDAKPGTLLPVLSLKGGAVLLSLHGIDPHRPIVDHAPEHTLYNGRPDGSTRTSPPLTPPRRSPSLAPDR